MRKINTLLLCSLLIGSVLFAQKKSISSFYISNMNVINPAYAGVDNLTLFTTTMRKQWTGIVDAPETQTVSISTPVKKNLGLGLSIINDKTFIEKQTYVTADFSYKLKMSEAAAFYLGIKVGGNFYNVNTSGLETYAIVSDPVMQSVSDFNPNIGVGALYKNGAMDVSLAVPAMFKTSRAINDLQYAMEVAQDPHYYFSSGYDFHINNSLTDLTLKPSVLLRYQKGTPLSVDFTTMLKINKKLNVGILYRTDKAYSSMATIEFGNHFIFGFAYEKSTLTELTSARNTNEFLLQYKF